MATSYSESIPSMTSKTTRSVYQTDSKPLSNEAIYRAKLKYGIYNNPAKVSLGVDPSASDTAAVLAANTDLTVHQYTKELSSEAAHAALIAKPNSIVNWERQNVAPEAEYAAISAKSQKFPFSGSTAESAHSKEEAAAAVSALKKPSAYIARENLQDIYDFDDVRSGKATLSQFSTTKSKSLLSSKKDYRSGIQTSNNAAEGSRKMNIAQLTKAATQTANASINTRLTPEKNFRSGIKSKDLKEDKTKDSSMYIKDIHYQAIQASKKELAKSHTRSMGIQTASDKGLAVNPSSYAASALKHGDAATTGGYADAEKATLQNNSLVDLNIYAIAAAKVGKKLQDLDSQVDDKTMFSNKKFNEAAYAIAQANHEKRKQLQPNANEVSIGAGKKMKLSDITKIAESLVKPAISDMETKIVDMRAIDEERKLLPAKIKQRELEFKEEKRQEQIALENKRAEEAKARRDQLVLDKKALDEEHERIKEELNEAYEQRETEFNEQVESETNQKKLIDDERSEKLKILNNAKEEMDNERKAELDTMQNEKDLDIAPLLEEHAAETNKLSEITSQREECERVFNEESTKTENLQSELDETLSKIEIMNARIAELEESLAEVEKTEETVVSEALLSEAKLHEEGKFKEDEFESFKNQRVELETKRAELHGELSKNSEDLKNLAGEHHNELKEIYEIYPEHLRKDVVAPKDFDDSTLNDSKFVLDDSELPIPDEIEDEPEIEKEEVWPKVEESEHEHEPEPEVTKEEVDDTGINTTSATSKPVVQKKTWEEVKAAGLADGSDPLINVPTQEKPAMADVVGESHVRDSVAYANDYKKNRTGKSDKKTERAPAAKSNKKSGGFLGLFKSKKEKDVPKSTKKSEPVKKAAPVKKEKVVAQPAEKPVAADVKEEKSGAAANEDGDVFSGFSQGSVVEQEEKADVPEVLLPEKDEISTEK